MPPKIGNEPILPGFKRGLYARKEPQSHPGDLAASSVNTLSVNLRKLGSMLHNYH
jgi:hypothetical protein